MNRRELTLGLVATVAVLPLAPDPWWKGGWVPITNKTTPCTVQELEELHGAIQIFR
jgi:hypothetical protein